ncbi:homeobox protein cut-like 1 [Octopus bimaculoides]|uniref:homeobox protein cut-like 1 n=1 Tax=Octopus bimaculoides TaxID=37653 RepID=UPI0022E86B30|nr:homeobox protein cut-like 1 [Octopus bimaculoides]
MEMVIKDLQSAKQRTESSEREVEQLRQQLASATQNLHQVEQMEKATDMEQAVDVLKQSRLEVELAAKDKEISQLVEDIQKLRATYNSLQESTSARISKLELAISRKNKAFHLLELKLKSKEEFDELQQNLISMKSSEFSELCDDEEPSSPTSERSLEMLLMLDKAKSEQRSTPTQHQDSDSQPLNLTESENSGIKKQPPDSVLKETYTKPAGSQGLITSTQREDTATEERINQILSAAQHAMKMKSSEHSKSFSGIQHTGQQRSPSVVHDLTTNLSHPLQVSTPVPLSAGYKEHSKNTVSSSKSSLTSTNGTATMNSIGRSSPSAVSVNSSRSRSESGTPTERKHSHKNISSQNSSSKEREMAAKEMVTRIYREELTKLAQAAESAGNVAASTMYQQELARIAQNIHRNTPQSQESFHQQDKVNIKTEPPDSSSEENASQTNGPIDLSKPHSAPQTPTTEAAFADSTRHSGSAFCLVRPRLNGQDSYEPSRFSSYLPSDCLSPLQRMQNIANSLTTRSHIGTPSTKPLKAVLPPITQEQFDKYSNIDTDILVKQVKETLSQYSISQRLFGENVLGLSQGSVSDLLARPKPWHMLTQKGREPFIRMQIFLEDGEAIPKLVASQYRIPPDKLMRSNSQSQESSSSECLSDTHQCASVGRQLQSPPVPTKASNEVSWAGSGTTGSSRSASPATGGYPSSMFEIAAMTSEIDTLEVTSRVKEVLQFHNLGQRLFGEAVLGLSQGSVSELLSKPKPWHMLSIKGREPFIKMHIWLVDPHNTDRLKCYQNELKDVTDYNSVDWFELVPASTVSQCCKLTNLFAH